MRWGYGLAAPCQSLEHRIEEIWTHAYDSPIGPQGPCRRGGEDKKPGAAELAAEARSVRARLHADAQEAELGSPQGRPRAADQRHRGDHLYPWSRPQPAGALDIV